MTNYFSKIVSGIAILVAGSVAVARDVSASREMSQQALSYHVVEIDPETIETLREFHKDAHSDTTVVSGMGPKRSYSFR